jgi:hypothetical protein
VGLALLLRLNKPLILAATFVNNPLLLAPTVVSSIELGGFLRHGLFQPWRHLIAFSSAQMKEEIFSWLLGSVVLGLLAGGAAAMVTMAVVYWLTPAQRSLRQRIRFVNRTYAGSAHYDRGFVRWKMRLDRIFSLLAAEDLGTGTVVDLGCGYGMALCERPPNLRGATGSSRFELRNERVRCAPVCAASVRPDPHSGCAAIFASRGTTGAAEALLRGAGARRAADLPGA